MKWHRGARRESTARPSPAAADAKSADAPGVIAPPPLIYAAGLGAGWALGAVMPLGIPLAGGAERAAGLALIALGAALAAWAFRAFHRAGTNANPYRPATALATRGPFRFSRNPIYVALTLIYAGLALAFDAAWAFVLLPGVLVMMQYGVIHREERYLERRFGPTYAAYKAAVRRWL